MGWNRGWAIFEETVIKAYDLGKLDKQMLAVLMEPYRDTDIDSGGKVGLLTKDCKQAEQVAIETFGLSMPSKPGVPHPKWSQEMTEEEVAAEEEWERYFEAEYEQFREVRRHFGW